MKKLLALNRGEIAIRILALHLSSGCERLRSIHKKTGSACISSKLMKRIWAKRGQDLNLEHSPIVSSTDGAAIAIGV